MWHSAWEFMVKYGTLAWIFNCVVLWLLGRSRQKTIDLLLAQRQELVDTATRMIEKAIDKGHSLGKASVYVEYMLRGGKLVATKAGEGMTLEEAQAKLDKIADDLQGLSPKVPTQATRT